jgi:hypothetical protein
MGTTSKLRILLGVALATAACDGPSGITSTALGSPPGTGSVSGTVTANGAPRGGVSVIAVGAQRDSTATDASGTYRFATLSTGTYNVSVQVPIGLQLAPGQNAIQTVTVTTGGSATANFALQTSPGGTTP